MRARYAIFSLLFLIGNVVDAQAVRLRLSWTDNADNERGFSIERRQRAGEPFAIVAQQTANVVSYLDVGVSPGTAYCYQVRAFNEVGQSDYSNESCATTSSIELTEGPSDAQSVAGLGVIRGWAFDARAGQRVKELQLFIDGTQVLRVPCCSPRGDVQAGFPQLPESNTLNSGWGTAVNWGVLPSGPHVVQLRAESTSGDTLLTDEHRITAIRVADSSFLDRFSLAQASARIEENDLVVERIVVRDKDSQRQARVTVRLRWLPNEQSFRIVATETEAQLSSSSRSLLSSAFATLRTWLPSGPDMAIAQSSAPILGVIESPGVGQISAGVGMLRGWAFSEDAGATIRAIAAFVDGQPIGILPCCSVRGDVAAFFPNYPSAGNSGWGAVVNYGALPTGSHTISIQVTDSRELTHTFTRGIETIRIGDATFIEDLNLTEATASIEDEDIIISGVSVREQATQETHVVTLHLRWFENSQSLSIVASTAGF